LDVVVVERPGLQLVDLASGGSHGTRPPVRRPPGMARPCSQRGDGRASGCLGHRRRASRSLSHESGFGLPPFAPGVLASDPEGFELVGTVTIAASYGSGGSVIAPAVADRLGLALLDRAIPASVATELAEPLLAALADDERHEGGLVGRLFSRAVTVSGYYQGSPLTIPTLHGDDLLDNTALSLDSCVKLIVSAARAHCGLGARSTSASRTAAAAKGV